MSAHTPGPWAVRIGDQSVGTGQLVEVVAANGEIVCCNERYYPTALAERDAPIIAAAPELLAALKSVVRSCRKDFRDEADPEGTFRKAYAEELALIAKAEGRE